MNKQRLSALQKTIDDAVNALEKLEAALDEGDNRKIGARLYELRRILIHAAVLTLK